MDDLVPIPLPMADPPRRNRGILALLALSAIVHGLVLGWLLLPRSPPPPPADPQSISVELVPPSEISSLELSIEASSASSPPEDQASSEAPSSGVSAPESAASEPPSAAEASSASASVEPPSSAQADSSEPPAAEPPASGAPSAEAMSASEPPPSGEPASGASGAAPPSPPTPHERPLTLPVGPSTEPSDAASTTGDSSAPLEGDGAIAAPDAAPPPADKSLLHAAKRFYLASMLDTKAMAKVREALKTLPAERRLAQTCNIEAVGQIGNSGTGLSPDALIANAFADPVAAGTRYSVGNGAFRSGGKWYSVAYECTLSDDLSAVTSFAFLVGGDVTGAIQARLASAKPPQAKAPPAESP